MSETDGISDYELVMLVRENNEKAFELLCERYRKVILAIWKQVHTPSDSMTYDDAMQAGRIGLYNSIQYYREDRNMSFHGFANICITREIRYWQHREWNKVFIGNQHVLSLDTTLRDPEGIYLEEVVTTGNNDLSTAVNSKMFLERLYQQFDPATSLEGKVVEMRMLGYSYQEIAQRLNINKKKVDNILQKVKHKMDSWFD